jgi:hypothetical protein
MVANFHVIADIVRNVAITAAVLIGGGWTLYVFRTLGSRQQSQAQLLKLKAEAAKLEVEAFKQSVVRIQIDAAVEDLSDGQYLTASAIVENVGDRNTKLDFQGWNPFRVYRVPLDARGVGDMSMPTPIADGAASLRYMTLRAKAAISFPFFMKLRCGGIYVIEFAVPLSEEDLTVHAITAKDGITHRGDQRELIVWSNSTYIIVDLSGGTTESL